MAAVDRSAAAYLEIDEAGIAEERKQTDRLVAWLQKNDCSLPFLYFEYYAVDFRGVHINSDAKKNLCLLEVAPKCLITTELARNSQIGTRITRSGCRLRSTHSYVACYILQERQKGEASFWKPYIDMFPKSYRHMPILFDNEELGFLKGSLCIPELASRQKAHREEYDNICRYNADFPFTLDDFIWARLVVLTRIFGITYQGKKTSAMVPMADMLNHKRPPDTFWTFDNNIKAFTITATKEFKKGEQVFDSYGCKCNTIFFMNYGFVAENNKWNETTLTVAVPDGDPLHRRKVSLVGVFSGKGWRLLQIPADYKHANAQEVFSFLRIAVATEAELNRICGGEYYRPNTKKVRPVNIRNEREVLKALSICAQARMQDFETTIEEDQKLIDENQYSRNIMNCIRTRQCEKKVLQYYIDLERMLLNVLDVKSTCAQARQAMTTEHPGLQAKTHPRYYVDTVILPLLQSNSDDTIGYLIDQFAHMRVSEQPA